MELPVRWKWKLNRLRERINAFFAPREEEAPRPKLCPACNTLVGATQSHCHECGASMTFSLAAASKTLRRWMPQENPASYSILALSAFLYTMGLMGTVAQQDQAPQLSGGLFGLFGILRVDSHILYRMGMSLPLPYNIAQPWRFITATFLHLSLIHIFFNMYSLLDLGPMVEEMYGSARFLFIYVVTGIGGFLLASTFNSYAAGGSCAVVGLVGLLLGMSSGHRGGSVGALRERLIKWAIYIAIFSLTPAISFYGHLGGGLTGFVLGKIMAPNPPLNPRDRKRANLMGWAAGLAVIASFAMVFVTYHNK